MRTPPGQSPSPIRRGPRRSRSFFNRFSFPSASTSCSSVHSSLEPLRLAMVAAPCPPRRGRAPARRRARRTQASLRARACPFEGADAGGQRDARACRQGPRSGGPEGIVGSESIGQKGPLTREHGEHLRERGHASTAMASLPVASTHPITDTTRREEPGAAQPPATTLGSRSRPRRRPSKQGLRWVARGSRRASVRLDERNESNDGNMWTTRFAKISTG